MTTLPAGGYISNAARTQAEVKQALEDTIAAIGELLGGKVESTLTLASDACTPTGGVHAIDSEAAASADNLATLNQTNTPDGRMLLIRAANAGHVITVKHAAGGTGQILLADSVDLVLQSTKQWLLLKRTGTSWEEVLRSYGDQKSLMRTWQQIATTPQTKSANYTAAAADRGRLLVMTGTTWTLGLTAAATLGSDWYLPFRNDATGEITIDPNASEQINGAATITIGPGETGLIVCDGTGFKTVGEPLPGRLIGVRVFSTPGTSTYTPTVGTRSVVVEVQAGGGGSGGVAATGASASTAAGGGGGGGYARKRITSSFSGVTVTVGDGGSAGTTGANGGGSGGSSSFGALVSATGGAGGAGGSSTTPTAIPSDGGAGGAGSGGDVNVTSGPGGCGITLNFTHSTNGGAGGNSVLGGGARHVTASAAGTVGNNYGGGAAGAANLQSQAARAGAKGGQGAVIVWEYA